MSKEKLANPYIAGVEAMTKDDVHHQLQVLVDSDSIAYYGLNPSEPAALRREYPAIKVEDSSGRYPYSVLIAGDLSEARKVLIKNMPWSDHPGRGFETLREAMVSDPDSGLAVIGVSHPGAGLNSPHMTKKQKESLKGPEGSFSFIGAQQWEAIEKAMKMELEYKGIPATEIQRTMQAIQIILSGSSLGSSGAVGMLESKPDWARVVALGLAEATDTAERSDTGMFVVSGLVQAKRHIVFGATYLMRGGDFFDDYVAVNPYNQYEALGPGHQPFLNAAHRPASHVGKTIGVMVRGNMASRAGNAINEFGLKDIQIKMRSGAEDALSRPADLARAATEITRLSGVDVDYVSHPNHFHPYLENLANAQAEFRGFTR